MNIFFVHNDPAIAAQCLCNAHVRSQIKESAQILSTIHYICGNDDPLMDRPTHKHHPCTKWAMENHHNYEWLYKHFCALLDEYQLRHGVPNKREPLRPILKNLPEVPYHGGVTYPPLVTKGVDILHKYRFRIGRWNAIIWSYRLYYNTHKRHLFYWMGRDRPDWIIPDDVYPVLQTWSEVLNPEPINEANNP